MTRFVAASLLLVAIAAFAADPVVIETTEPRSFGYVIGDVLERRIAVEVTHPWRLVADSAPKPGRLNRWFDIAATRLTETSKPGARRYDIVVTYQLMNAPEVTDILVLPPVALKFDGDTEPLRITTSTATVFASPLLPPEALGSTLDQPREDDAPTLIDTSAMGARVRIYALLAAVAAAMWAWLRFGAFWRHRGPFARASRKLRRLNDRGNRHDARAESVRIVHRAFDETAGRALLRSDLDRFFAERPNDADLRERTEEFFRLSQRQFFAGDDIFADDMPIALASAWRAREINAHSSRPLSPDPSPARGEGRPR